jgi:iron complex outermembrane receptor protein
MRSNVVPTAFAVACSACCTALAQTARPPDTAPVQSLVPVFVTASPLGSALFDLADPVNLLEGRQLLLNRQPTLGETLDQEVGVSSTYYGPNASRPIIRGLGGFDIRLLNNGLGLLDASAASPDHAVAASPFAVERIEVVRGPAAVMYGGAAIGGVVNTIDSRIAQAPPAKAAGGSASYTYGSQNDLSAGGARVDAGTERFAVHADGYASRNGDLKIPGSAWTAQEQAARGEPGPSGSLPNSRGDSQTWGIGASAFVDQRGYLGVSYGRFATHYGTVAEPSVSIDLQQQAWNLAGELRDTVPALKTVRLKYGYNDYTHTEFDDGEPGTVFDSKGWNLRLEGLHGAIGPVEGAIGFEFGRVDFSAQGDEAFVPSTRTRSAAAFVYEELRRQAWKFSAGGRVERVEIDAQAFPAPGLPADAASFTPYSLALGAVHDFDRGWGLGANLQYTQRAPAAQELFADGPHIATAQFEVGNRDLGKVSATSLDLTLTQRGDAAAHTLSAFFAEYSNYIALLPAGVWRNPEDRAVVSGPEPIVDPETGEVITPLQQFDYRQVRARFYGFEAQTTFALWRQGASSVSMKLQADYVRAVDRGNGQSLPFIPPLRVGASVAYERGGLTATLGGLFAAAQNKVPEFQTSTPGYANVFANATYRWLAGAGITLEAFLQGINLLDQTIRYSTSNLKDIAPAGSRALLAGVRGVF